MPLTTKQIETLSKVFIDFGKIIFATLVVSNFLPKNLVSINYPIIFIGLIISGSLIIIGISILKGVDNR